MAVSASDVKALREATGAGMMDCKKALTEADGNMEKATEILREKGLAAAAKKSGRIAAEGVVASYIHMGGRIGVLVEVNCETDFVAKTDQFQSFVRDIAMQIAASNPLYLSSEEVPQDTIDKEKEILRIQAINEGKPEKIVNNKAVLKNTSKRFACWISRLSKIRTRALLIMSKSRSLLWVKTLPFAALPVMKWAKVCKNARITS